MRARKPSRKELRELGEGLLAFAEFMGFLFTFGAMVRYVTTAPNLLSGLVAGACMLIMVIRRLDRWLNRPCEREQAD